MEFQNVRVVKKANVYYDGKVTSRTILFDNGEKKTLGFMLAGEYEFNTAAQEVMEVLGGEIDVMIKGEDTYKNYQAGQSFIVPENSSFKMIVKTYTDYCCSYQE